MRTQLLTFRHVELPNQLNIAFHQIGRCDNPHSGVAQVIKRTVRKLRIQANARRVVASCRDLQRYEPSVPVGDGKYPFFQITQFYQCLAMKIDTSPCIPPVGVTPAPKPLAETPRIICPVDFTLVVFDSSSLGLPKTVSNANHNADHNRSYDKPPTHPSIVNRKSQIVNPLRLRAFAPLRLIPNSPWNRP